MPYVADREDLNGLLEAVKRENAPLVYFANPDNPMGSWWDADSIIAFARALPETCLMILDEAYSETAPAGSVPAMEALIDQPNVLRMRTFSKAYGLAGARIGYAIGTPETVVAFDKIRNHFGMVRLSTEAHSPPLPIRTIWQRCWRRLPHRGSGSPGLPGQMASPRFRQPRISSPSIAGATPCMRAPLSTA